MNAQQAHAAHRPIFDEDALQETLTRTAQENNRSGFKNPIFVTGVKKGVLFNAFLSGLKNDKERQEYNCACCREFVRRYGHLAVIGDDGLPKSLLWNEDNVNPRFAKSFRAMRELVEADTFTRVFQSDNTFFGQSERGGYAHMSFDLGIVPNRTHNSHKSANQASMISAWEFRHLSDYVEKISKKSLIELITLFENDARLKAYPSFKNRLIKIRQIRDNYDSHRNVRARYAAIWYAVAMDTPDIIFFKNTVLGELLKEFELSETVHATRTAECKRLAIIDFMKNTRQEVYMRPTEPPKQGTVAQAEKIVERLGIQPSFERRQVTIDDLSNFSWKPEVATTTQTEKTGFFKDIQTKDSQSTKSQKPRINGGTMTYVKFVRDVLPKAKSIKLIAPRRASKNWTALLTAVHPEAPPIFKWDNPEQRNTVSSFILVTPGPSEMWNVPSGSEAEVLGIIQHPRDFASKLGEYGDIRPVLFVIKNAHLPKDSTPVCIFPEDMRPDLHEVRSVIEAYSNTHKAIDVPDAVSGFSMHLGSESFMIVVEQQDAEVLITLDRFE